MIFFTDITTDASNYCLLNIKSYRNKKKFNKRVCYIDPSVMELKEYDEFSNIEFMHELIETDQLLNNEYISIDYPCDMNKSNTKLYIQKSIDNNFKYASNLQYICTIQFRFMDYKDFVRQTERLRIVWELPDKIIGMGNMCRIMKPNSFTNNVFRYIRNNMRDHRIHFYGLALKVIKSSHFKSLLRAGFNISVDSTKWTRAVTEDLKKKYGVACRKDTRNIYFLEYINEIRKAGIEVKY